MLTINVTMDLGNLQYGYVSFVLRIQQVNIYVILTDSLPILYPVFSVKSLQKLLNTLLANQNIQYVNTRKNRTKRANRIMLTRIQMALCAVQNTKKCNSMLVTFEFVLPRNRPLTIFKEGGIVSAGNPLSGFTLAHICGDRLRRSTTRCIDYAYGRAFALNTFLITIKHQGVLSNRQNLIPYILETIITYPEQYQVVLLVITARVQHSDTGGEHGSYSRSNFERRVETFCLYVITTYLQRL